MLSRDAFEAMYAAALRMADELGIAASQPLLQEAVYGCSGFRACDGRIHVSPSRIEEVLELLRNSYRPAASRPERPNISITDRPSLFVDHRKRELRPLARTEMIAGTKLIDVLASRGLVTGTGCGTPQDSPEAVRPFEQYLLSYRFSRGGGSTAVMVEKPLRRYMHQMREIAEDGYNPGKISHTVWLPSPLRLDGNELDELIESDGEVIHFAVGSMPIMGLTGPVDPIGVLTLAMAETLGAAAVLKQLYRQAQVDCILHPQPMDPRSGLMAFGSPEWNKLELLKIEVYRHLGLGLTHKENLTASCMPDERAQWEKTSSLALGMTWGCRSFQLYPLCGDEGFSPVQLLLDIAVADELWHSLQPANNIGRANAALETLRNAVTDNEMIAGLEDTVEQLSRNYIRPMFTRYHSANQWQSAGRPELIETVEEHASQLISQWSYEPPPDKIEALMEVYEHVCRETGCTNKLDHTDLQAS